LACREGHQVHWNKAKILQIGTTSRQRKYKESCHTVHLTHFISQPKSGTSPMLIQLANKEVSHYSNTWTALYSFLLLYLICSHVSLELDKWGLGFWFHLVVMKLNLLSVSVTRFCGQRHNLYDILKCTGAWNRQSMNPLCTQQRISNSQTDDFCCHVKTVTLPDHCECNDQDEIQATLLKRKH